MAKCNYKLITNNNLRFLITLLLLLLLLLLFYENYLFYIFVSFGSSYAAVSEETILDQCLIKCPSFYLQMFIWLTVLSETQSEESEICSNIKHGSSHPYSISSFLHVWRLQVQTPNFFKQPVAPKYKCFSRHQQGRAKRNLRQEQSFNFSAPPHSPPNFFL